jgi:hypothetical protein
LFQKATTLFNLDGISNVYFVQAAENNLYEVVFGDGYFGRRPQNQALIQVQYIVTHGSDANGIKEFTLAEDLGPINGGKVDPLTIRVNQISSGGANQEGIESVRFSAPRYFATQQRAVSQDDYASLVLSNFGGEIDDCAVYGGETVEPKRFGRVILCLKPSSGTVTPNYVKSKVSNYLKNYIVIPNRIVISDPEYVYIYMKSIVEYNIYQTNKTPKDVESVVINAIISFSETNLEHFNSDFRYSRLVTFIDNSDKSISSNQSDVRAIKRITPKLNYPSTFVLDINNAIDTSYDYAHVENVIKNPTYDAIFEIASVISSRFNYIAKTGIYYDLCYIQDDSTGILSIFSVINNILTKIEDIGTVDYKKGIMYINDIRVSNYENHISVYCRTVNKDILASKTKIIIIDPNDLDITVRETSY